MTVTVPLSGKKGAGLVALIDEEDSGLVSPFRWYALFERASRTIYAHCHVVKDNGTRTMRRMHQLIARADNIDHVDGNGLNNTRTNLREATSFQNRQNRQAMARDGSSGYKGVWFDSASQKWRAGISTNGVRVSLGRFAEAEEAARAYDAIARLHFGPFGCYNFPLPGERSAR